jgi:hypothetical protein
LELTKAPPETSATSSSSAPAVNAADGPVAVLGSCFGKVFSTLHDYFCLIVL